MSIYFNYGLSQNRILIIMTDFKDGEGDDCMERLLFKKWSALVPMVSSMNSLFSSLFLVRWCGRLVGEDLVEDYNAFRVERRGVSRRRQTIKWDCGELTANLLPKRRGGGGNHENITGPYEGI